MRLCQEEEEEEGWHESVGAREDRPIAFRREWCLSRRSFVNFLGRRASRGVTIRVEQS